MVGRQSHATDIALALVVKENIGIKEAARRAGVAETTLRRALSRQGIKLPRQRPGPKPNRVTQSTKKSKAGTS
jgi:hypothetical protein